ncbi:MAG: 30S ribosomal protein S30 [Betaproteobacteria bacterium RIFCSPLOWO2_12_FULL_65_14]|nr:MAG: 30S ribosomal protein S30 [Betaproteobacteria bacterium RIFCSPLOWO2_12_FULL_65_14]
MQIDIQTHGFALSDALRDYTERRLRFALARAAERVRRIKVGLSDINGPRGGIDKRCRIRVMFRGLDAVLIEDTEADLYVAIDRAADRVWRTVVRRLGRRGGRGDEPAMPPVV